MSAPRKVVGTLEGVDGNAFALMGHFRRLARRQGWADGPIDAVLAEAKSSDYAHLVSTLDAHMTSREEEA